MTIETSLQIRFMENLYGLTVKMIRIEPASYFFISDLEQEKSLLAGQTLQLTRTGESFSLTEFGGIVKSPGIPEEIQDAVKKVILENDHLWLS